MTFSFISRSKEVKQALQAATERALEICGGKAESYAKQLCPVDTGNLHNSITHQQYNKNTEVVGSNVEYAPFIELGYHHVSGKKMPAKPYLRPAAEGHSEEYKAVFMKELKNA